MRHAERLLRCVTTLAFATLSGLAPAQTGTGTGPTAPAAVVPAPAGTPAQAQQAQPMPAARWTLEQIRQSFALADTDGNAQLTRAEAQRLTIMPLSFESADENKDGVLVLREYEASFGQ
jgi:hypothetical protein